MHETAIAGEGKKEKKEERERKRKKFGSLFISVFVFPKVVFAVQRNAIESRTFDSSRFVIGYVISWHAILSRFEISSRGSLVEKMLAGLWVTGDRSKLLPIKEPLCDSISLISERRKFTTSFDGITM